MNIVVDYKAGEVSTNFDEVKAHLKREVEKYSIEVTEANVVEAKKLMASLNKVKKAIGDKYKEYIDLISEPVNRLKDEKRELENIVQKGRASIESQVKVFEQKRLDAVLDLVLEYKRKKCEEVGVDPEAVIVNDLAKLSAVTSAGKLNKTTKEAIDARVAAIQNEILKAKLETEEKARREREIAQKARLEAEERAKHREIELARKMEAEKQRAIEEAKKETLSKATVQKSAPVEKEPGTWRICFSVKARTDDPEKVRTFVVEELKGTCLAGVQVEVS